MGDSLTNRIKEPVHWKIQMSREPKLFWAGSFCDPIRFSTPGPKYLPAIGSFFDSRNKKLK